MSTMIVCLRDARERRAIAATIGRSVRVIECDNESDVLATARAARASVVICEPRGNTPDAWERTIVMLRALVDTVPDVRVIAVCSLGRDQVPAIIEIYGLGVNAVALQPHDDVIATVRRVISPSPVALVAHRVMNALAPHLSVVSLPFVSFCIGHAHRPLSVAGIADRLGVSRRTLVRRCRREHVPLPEDLIAWCRLMMVTELAAEPGGSLERASLVLGFQNAADVRTRLKRHTALTLHEVRASGGLVTVFVARFGGGRNGRTSEWPRPVPVLSDLADVPMHELTR